MRVALAVLLACASTIFVSGAEASEHSDRRAVCRQMRAQEARLCRDYRKSRPPIAWQTAQPIWSAGDAAASLRVGLVVTGPGAPRTIRPFAAPNPRAFVTFRNAQANLRLAMKRAGCGMAMTLNVQGRPALRS